MIQMQVLHPVILVSATHRSDSENLYGCLASAFFQNSARNRSRSKGKGISNSISRECAAFLRKADRVRWPRRSCVCLAQLPWFPGLNMVPENGSVVVHTFDDVAWSAFACVGGAGRRRQEHLVFLSHRRWRRRQMRPLAFVQPDDGG